MSFLSTIGQALVPYAVETIGNVGKKTISTIGDWFTSKIEKIPEN